MSEPSEVTGPAERPPSAPMDYPHVWSPDERGRCRYCGQGGAICPGLNKPQDAQTAHEWWCGAINHPDGLLLCHDPAGSDTPPPAQEREQ